MPPARLALILITVAAAAAVTVALGALVAGRGGLPPAALYAAVPAALVAWLLVRLVRDRGQDRSGK